jgi:hypothetical protein
VQLLVDRLEVLTRLPVGVGLAVEVVQGLGTVRLGLEKVVGLEAEAPGELPDRGVALVDELAAALDQLVVGEGAPQGPATAADPVRGLVHGRRLAGLLELVGAGQPGQPTTHDGDPPREDGRRLGPTGPDRDSGRGGRQPEYAAQLERVTAGQAPLLGCGGLGCGLLERLREWGTGHDRPPCPRSLT